VATSETKPRIVPLEPPYEAEVARTLERMMPPGVEPLKLFRTVAHNRHILDKLRSTGAYLLNFGALDPLDRELVIHRTCARCGSEYEWGVHAVAFGRPLGLSEEQIQATVTGSAEDPVWDERQSVLLQLVDQLHERAAISEELWRKLAERWSPPQLVELIVLVGQYHCISFLTNGLQVELEEAGDRFPAGSNKRAAN
jgi:4-carboxymuconolactone decarboxylase